MNTRRDFLKSSGYLAAGFFGLKHLAGASAGNSTAPAAGSSVTSQLPMRQIGGYGPLQADPAKVFALPEGFSYQILARAGEKMDDGYLIPGAADGMAAFGMDDGRIGLICNHELSPDEVAEGPFGAKNELLGQAGKDLLYDHGRGQNPHQGGTTTIVFNPRTRQKELQYLSLAGTERNCAGGPTPWGSWVTCEETNTRADGVFEKDHGYNFEVPFSPEIRPAKPVALEEMGRFRHEAIAVDPRTGIVYQTEDMGDGLIYRFLPKVKGALHEGGSLQALAIKDEPSRDTRNWQGLEQPVFPLNEAHAVEWIDIEDVRSPDDSLRLQGFAKGAARFARAEGMWYGNGEIYFACTNGGAILEGQVFRYVPSRYEGTPNEDKAPGQLDLFIESSDRNVLKNCDNLTVAPWGDLFICEDADQPCKLTGVTPDGSFFEFGSNAYSDSELAGVCFDPSGNWLFVNIQRPGLTLAITGPWNRALA